MCMLINHQERTIFHLFSNQRGNLNYTSASLDRKREEWNRKRLGQTLRCNPTEWKSKLLSPNWEQRGHVTVHLWHPIYLRARYPAILSKCLLFFCSYRILMFFFQMLNLTSKEKTHLFDI